MDLAYSFRGRDVTQDHLQQIRDRIANDPELSRRKLSIDLCHKWKWLQPNKQPCDAKCRTLLLAMHREGLIQLPEPRWKSQRPPRRVRPVQPPLLNTEPIECLLAELGTLQMRQVRRTTEEPLVQWMLEAYHYLGYNRPVGEHLKYLVTANERPMACFLWSSAPRHLAPRDRYIGWTPTARRAGVHMVAYQSRFLILPWVHVPHLASHLLGRMNRRLCSDWQAIYAHPIHFVETFVDPTRYRGTCYRASNWTYLGQTKGRGKDDQTHRPNRSLKDVYGYALRKDFRTLLSSPSGEL